MYMDFAWLIRDGVVKHISAVVSIYPYTVYARTLFCLGKAGKEQLRNKGVRSKEERNVQRRTLGGKNERE